MAFVTIVLLVVIGGALAVAVWAMGLYNGLVGKRNQVRNAWSQIDVQLKRRHDLIPNLVETVKGYAAHEKTTLEGVTRARSQAVAATGVEAQGRAESDLTSALGRLMVLVEQYPALQANQNFLGLQEELSSTENRIGFARQFYNDAVMQMNNAVQAFPSNILAGMYGFREEPFFELKDDSERAVPQVKISQA